MKIWKETIDEVTWDSDITLTGDVVIDPEVTLTIAPGVVVTFQANQDDAGGGADSSKAELIIEGKLIADGTDINKITFQSSIGGSSKGDWYGIVFAEGSSSESTLDNCIIKNARFGVECSASPTISNCDINNNSEGIVIKDNALPDLGRQQTDGSIVGGGNTFEGNSSYDIASYVPPPSPPDDPTEPVIYAQGNYWNSVSQADIDARIYDDKESNGQSGKV